MNNRFRSNRMMTFGLFALVVANTLMYTMRRAGVPEGIADPVMGLAFGVAIMSTLIGVRRQARRANTCA